MEGGVGEMAQWVMTLIVDNLRSISGTVVGKTNSGKLSSDCHMHKIK